jgi:SAM-dependent methyltransferase
VNLTHNKFLSNDIRKENEEFNKEWISKKTLKGDASLTLDDLNIPSEKQKNSNQFQVVWLQNVVRLFDMLPTEVDISKYSLYDIGCGSGISTLFFADKYDFSKYVGFDFSAELIELAKNNLKLSQNNITNCHKINFEIGDVRSFKLPRTPLMLFLFNSVEGDLLTAFIERHLDDLKTTKSFLLYTNDMCIEDVKDYAKEVSRNPTFNLSVLSFG